MSRTAGTNLAANADSRRPEGRWLLRIGASRFANGGDADGDSISYDSQTWVKSDFEVTSFDDHAVVSGFGVSFSLTDDLKSTFSAIQAGDTFELYCTAALNTYVGANDVIPFYSGLVGGGWALQADQFTLQVGDFDVWPDCYIGPNIGLTEVMPPGEYQFGQQYLFILERAF